MDKFIEGLVENLIMPWQAMLVFGLIIAGVSGAEGLAYEVIKSNTVRVADAACMAQKIDAKDVIMNLDCGGIKDSTDSKSFIVAYLQAPKPFTCTLYNKSGWAECKFKN